MTIASRPCHGRRAIRPRSHQAPAADGFVRSETRAKMPAAAPISVTPVTTASGISSSQRRRIPAGSISTDFRRVSNIGESGFYRVQLSSAVEHQAESAKLHGKTPSSVGIVVAVGGGQEMPMGTRSLLTTFALAAMIAAPAVAQDGQQRRRARDEGQSRQGTQQ